MALIKRDQLNVIMRYRLKLVCKYPRPRKTKHSLITSKILGCKLRKYSKRKKKSQLTKYGNEKKEYMNDMKLIWGTRARLIGLGAKLQIKQMGSNHSSVPECVVP